MSPTGLFSRVLVKLSLSLAPSLSLSRLVKNVVVLGLDGE